MREIDELGHKLINLKHALDRLEEALIVDPLINELVVDAVIKRFEIVWGLTWTTLKMALEIAGVSTFNTPREVLKDAFSAKWIEEEKGWLQMLKDRNNTSHVYDEGMAMEIYRRIKRYPYLLNENYAKISRFVIEIQRKEAEE